VSDLITVTFDPRDSGIQRYEWDTFSSEHGLKLDDRTGKFCRNGVEVEYRDGRHIVFSAVFPTTACDSAIVSATDLWKRYGGNFTASPEVRAVINDVIFEGMI
jgi:hypothetical protein